MASEAPAAQFSPQAFFKSLPVAVWVMIAGVALLAVPSLISMGAESWSTEAGMHGPIVLATGIWLLSKAWPQVKHLRREGRAGPAWAGMILGLVGYIFGRVFGFLFIEISGLFLFFLSIAYLYLGAPLLKKIWFPILYLGFLIPLPGWLMDQMTAPLKVYVSWSATHLLSAVGYPIVREGVILFVDQYQLMVEDACAGLNSIISLTSISLFYIYLLHNASWRYSLFLMLWILPAALFANLIRVIMLVLITYHFGNAAAQGFLHSTAGIVMFVAALLSIFVIDRLMTPMRRRLSEQSA